MKPFFPFTTFLALLTMVPLLVFEPGAGYLETSPFKAADKAPDHTLWQYLLERHVDSSGFVDYRGFLGDKEILKGYLKVLQSHQPEGTWPKNERLAYYINLYNARTVMLILDNYPTESIKKINRPWDQKLIPLHGEMISLGDLEHQILRKMGEPRIHFAINCASASCPKLSNKAYLADDLDVQLDLATKDFIHSDRNRIGKERLQLSKIFKWYDKDFTDGDVRAYLSNYTPVPISRKVDIEYLPYDWSLNGK